MNSFRILFFTVLWCPAMLVAHADTFAFSYSGAGITAAGTFAGVLTSSPGVYRIDTVTGTRNGLAITGLGYAVDYADELLYYPPTGTGTGLTPAYLDNSGIAYVVDGQSYNIYTSDSAPTVLEGDPGTPVSLSVVQVVTPEPASPVLLATGMLSMIGVVRRRITA